MFDVTICDLKQTSDQGQMIDNQIIIKPTESIERVIWEIRGQRVILSPMLAELYGVLPKVLMQSVKRNMTRFPADFMFQLTRDEFDILKSQFVTSREWGGLRKLPYAFTEQGVAMLSSALNSERAIEVNIAIMRTFVQMREMMQGHKDLTKRLDAVEQKYDAQFRVVFDAIKKMMAPPAKGDKKMGFEV